MNKKQDEKNCSTKNRKEKNLPCIKNEDFPSQHELEKEISEYLSKKYGGRIRVVSQMVFPHQIKPNKFDDPPGQETKRNEPISFDLKPEELEAYLDQYVVKQDEAKAILATKICTHFNRIKYMQQKGNQNAPIGNIKNNIILIGPTGVGKTFLVKLIAAKIGVPFVKGDATKFSETGYVGGDVEDLIRDLVHEADGDIEKAQYGIVYIDEIDKIASPYDVHGPDVSRAGVQRALLKPMEETEVDLRTPHDPIAQLEALERYRRSGKREKNTINTKHILFIVSGAFSGLVDIIKKRLQKSSIGFGADVHTDDERQWLKYVKPQDLIEYGFESEFIGRLPVIAILDELKEEDLYLILKNPNSAVMVSKKQDFKSYGIDLRFEDEALRQLAHLAYQEGTGARALVSVIEKALLPFEKKLPSTGIDFLVVTKEMVDDPEGELKRLLQDPDNPDRRKIYEAILAQEREKLVLEFKDKYDKLWQDEKLNLTQSRLELMAKLCQKEDLTPDEANERVLFWVQQIKSYEDTFYNRCGITIVFDDKAIDELLIQSASGESNLYSQCERLCNILEYGLSLVRDKTGISEFEVPVEAIKNPELYINSLIRSCYHQK